MTMWNQRSAIRVLLAVVALTAALSCRDKGPTVTIAFPAQSSHFMQGDTVDFSADLNSDIDFGVIPSSAWRWISDIDGELGRSSSISTPALSVAEHQVTASVRHRLGLSRARVVVFVDSITAPGSTR
jgi:hypothetical protein